MNASVTQVMAFGLGITAVANRDTAVGRPAVGSMADVALEHLLDDVDTVRFVFSDSHADIETSSVKALP